MKMDCPGSGETQPKKLYETPQLIEHGAIEEITGDLTEVVASGFRDTNPK
jgi:hypothetical protein